jgi:hypothetical protein
MSPAGGDSRNSSNGSVGSSVVASSEAPAGGAPAVPPAPSLAARVAKAVALIQEAAQTLALGDVALSNQELKRALKFKKGGEQQLPKLAQLSARYGVEVPARPTAAMMASLDQATEVEPARTAIEELGKVLDDFYFGSRSDAWATATTLYGMLKKASRRQATLAAAMVPLQEFFAHRRAANPSGLPKNSAAKAAAKQAAKVQKRIEKLQGEIAGLQAVQAKAAGPGTATPAGPAAATNTEPAATPAPSPVAPAPSVVKTGAATPLPS